MTVKAIQQIMLGTVCKSEQQTLETLRRIKAAGYDGIELNQFMIQKTPVIVRALTKAAGMPVGKGGSFDWPALTREAGLSVVSLHVDLDGFEKDPDKAYAMARELGTDKLVLTGMYRFDYGSVDALRGLASRLNVAAAGAANAGFAFLYHNHNVEFTRVNDGDGELTAYEFLLRETDEDVLKIEFDSYWPAEAGVDVLSVMDRLGSRMKLYHINDRGSRLKKAPMTPILKSDSMELGQGNMPLDGLVNKALANGVDSIILESHRNWIDGDPLKSMELSARFLNEHVG